MKLDQVRIGDKVFQESDQSLQMGIASDRPTRIQVFLWVVLLIISVAVSLSNFLASQVGAQYDEDRYLILSRSLVYADRYGMIYSPGEPLPERYPFGYPLLISPIVRLFPDQIDAPKVLSLTATVINITLLFWCWPWFSRSRSYWWGVAITGLYALSPVTIDLSRRIMSEPVFMTFSLITILLAEKLVRGSSNRWVIPGLSLALTFVVFTRTIGVVLMACVFIYMLLQMRRAAWNAIFKISLQMGLLVSLIVAATPVQPVDLLPFWYLKNDKNARPLVTLVFGETTGLSEETDLTVESSPQPISSGLSQRLSNIPRLTISGLQKVFGENLRGITLPFGIGVLGQILDRSVGNSSLILSIYRYFISGLVVFGLFLLIRQERFSLFSVSPVLYLGALFLWNFKHPRLFYPIQPQIQLGWLIALEAVILWTSRVIKARSFSIFSTHFVLSSITILILTGAIINSFLITDSRVHSGDLRVRSEWLKTHTQASDIIMTEVPEVDYLYSGRKMIVYPNTPTSDEELEAYLIDNRIDYILVAPRPGWSRRYTPSYSDLTKDLLPLFEELEARNKIQLNHSQDADWIRVYHVQHGEAATGD